MWPHGHRGTDSQLTNDMDAKTKEAIDLLRTLIATPSPSRDESCTADLIFAYLAEHGAVPERLHNNVFARSAGFDPARRRCS